MLFNSYVFLIYFLPSVLAGFYLVKRRAGLNAALGFVAGASLFFYAWWIPWHLAVFAVSFFVNHALARQVAPSSRGGKAWLRAGVAFNLLLLGSFKYAPFAVNNVGLLLGSGWQLKGLALPLGISFFSFQQIMYLVDVHQGQSPAEGFLDHLLFLSFFPHFIAGPIVRSREIVPQFHALGGRAVPWEEMATGLSLFGAGLFKKVMIADSLAPMVDQVFGLAELKFSLSAVDAWGAALAFALQLYFDFSGYSDMALGLAHMFGVRFPRNFNSPYQAVSITDFWARWHITLSRFFREYVYIPLGGNRGGRLATLRNLLVTFLLTGLWHGASWTFVAWGFFHGCLVALHRASRPWGLRIPAWAGRATTFVAVLLLWVIFRAKTFGGAAAVYAGMWRVNTLRAGGVFVHGDRLVALAVLLGATLLLPNAVDELRREGSLGRLGAWGPVPWALAATLLLCILNMGHVTHFIYFDF